MEKDLQNTNANTNIDGQKEPEVNSSSQNAELNKEPEVKTFTQEEVNKIVQERLAKEKVKADKEREEAEKLAKMNAEEKAKYQLEQEQSKLRDREAAVVKRELQATAKEILADKGLSPDLSSLLNYESADSVNEGIKVLEDTIQKTVEKSVEERLKGTPPTKQNKQSLASAWDKIGAKYNKK